MRKLLIIVCLLLIPCKVFAACSGSSPTWTAADCSHAEITACITAASSGDTINVPSGTCTWSSTVTIPEGKTIKLIGAGPATCGKNGSCLTVINSAAKMINMYSNDSRLSGFRFNRVTGGGTSDLVELRGIRFRVDNNYLDDADYMESGHWTNCINANASNMTIRPEGLIDGNYLNHCKLLVTGSTIFNKDTVFWSDPSVIGTVNAVYFENNTLDRGGPTSVMIDSNYGGSYVVRFNNLIGSNAMAHALQGATERGTKSWEIYNNVWTFNNTDFSYIGFLRGGTGMMFNNTVTGPRGGAYTINLDNVRSFTTYGSNPSSGRCDGSSLWDGNTLGNGWPCRDQIGRGPDTALFNPPTYSASTSEPAFFWNNHRSNGQNVGIAITNGCDAWLVEGRDFYSAATYEALAVKPTHYTPYTCPHPLADPNGEYHCDFEVAGTAGYGMAGAPDPEPDPEPTGLILPWVITGG